MATRYAKQTGRNYPRWPAQDPIGGLAKFRAAPRWSAAHQNQYLPLLKHVARPVLGQLRMIEAAIRCDLACRDAVAAWRAAA